MLICSSSILCLADVSYRQLEPGKAEFKTDKAIVRVTVSSSIYTYEVTNLQGSPIVRFKIGQHHSYAFTPPDGWERQSEKDFFCADTNRPDKTIGFRQTKDFSVRVSSRGAVLGKSDIELRSESGQIIVIPGVWSPASETKSYPLAVAGTIIAIMLIQTVIVNRRSKRKLTKDISAP